MSCLEFQPERVNYFRISLYMIDYPYYLNKYLIKYLKNVIS